MDSLGFKTVKLAKLKLPGDVKKRTKEQRVKDMAETLKDEDIGLIEKPKVRKKDMLLVTGRDRIAAHMVAGKEVIEVELINCTDEVADKIDKISNAHRRHDRKEQERLMVELVDIYEKDEAGKPVARDRGPGRPETPRGKARKKVAKQMGVRPESVRMAEHRNKKRKQKQQAQKAKPPVATLGMPLGEEFLAECASVQRYIDEANGKLVVAQSTIQQLLNAELPVPTSELERLKGDVHDLASHLRNLRPESLCPYCKGIEGYQEHCTACVTRGWVHSLEMQNVPADLLLEGEEGIIRSQGNTYKLTDIVDFDDDGAEWFEG